MLSIYMQVEGWGNLISSTRMLPNDLH